MNLNPLLAGIAAASGGSTLLCYLKIRELTDRVWGISPSPYDFAPWTHGMVVSLVICLLSLTILTYQFSPEDEVAGEKLGPKRVRVLKKCALCLLHNGDPSDPESQTFEQYLELRPGDDIVIVPGGDDLVEDR